jgi:hypothetical protein
MKKLTLSSLTTNNDNKQLLFRYYGDGSQRVDGDIDVVARFARSYVESIVVGVKYRKNSF